MWNILKKLFKWPSKEQAISLQSYPNIYPNTVSSVRMNHIYGNAGSTRNQQILTIISNGITHYTVTGFYINNIIRNAITIEVHVESVIGEGIIPGKIIEQQVYTV